MDTNDSNLKPQPTGGLKLMTVFIAVLALHVVVIGSMTVYYMLKGGNSDADLVSDKTHKTVKIASDGTADASMADSGPTDKPASAPAATPAGPATATPTPAGDTTTISETAPADASSSESTAPDTTVTTSATPVTPTVPSSPDATASTPSGPVVTPPDGQGPVADTTVSPDASTAATEPSLEAESSSIIYKVKAHDTLARIAHRYHLTRAKLMAANGLKSERVKPGQRLTIPVRSVAAAAKPEESSGPNLTLLGDSIPDDAAKPVASTMHEKTMMTSSTGGHHTYTVVKGDTLSRIARRFHTSTNAILALNGAIDARKLRIGQKLRIPSRESRSASAAPVASPVAIPVQPDNDRIEPRATPSPQLANFMP